LRYVGQSGYDVYKTLYRHFQVWEDPKQKRVTYTYLKGITVRLLYCTKSKAADIERALILKYKPQDNPDKLLNYTISDEEKSIVAEIAKRAIQEVPF
jgi:hypothetical protein